MTARQQIKRHEGLRLKPYADTVGNLTIGYGHNLTDNGISQKVAEKVFREDYLAAEADAAYLVGGIDDVFSPVYDLLNSPRRAVLVNMAFNLGRPGLKSFRNMLRAVRRGDYASAAHEMLDSKWARQVGHRSTELAEQMRTGRWGKRA